APHGDTFTTLAAFGEPLVATTPSQASVTAMVEGARIYAQAVFGITLPDTVVPALEAYARAQLAGVVDAARGVLVGNDATQTPVNSLAWLQIDLALYGAGQVLPAETVSSMIGTWFATPSAWAQAESPAPPGMVCLVRSCKTPGTSQVLQEGCSC